MYNYSRSEFAGIRKNSTFAKIITKSFANQTVTLARTMEEEDIELIMYKCSYCNMVQFEASTYLIRVAVL